MVKTIEYENKEALQNDESVANKNKVTDGDINEIKDVVNNNAEALKLINSQIPTGQASGENITLNDSSDLPFESFKISGNSKQKTRKGINLFNKDNISNFANASQGYLVEGTKVKSYFIQCKPNTTYSAKRVTPNTDRFSIAFTSEVPADGVAITNIYPNPPNVDQSNNDVVISSTSAEDSQYVCITISNSAQEVPDIMLVEGLYTNENFPEYEEYGAMPSPEFPSEIKNVKSVNVKVCNNNLIDVQEANYGVFQNGVSSEGYVALTKNDGELKEEILKTYPSGFFASHIKVEGLVEGETYTISGVADTDFNRVYIYPEKLWESGITNGDLNTGVSFIATGTSAVIGFYSQNNTIVGTVRTIKNIQLEKGSTVTFYKPHQSQVFNFPLSEGQKLCGKSESEYDYLSDEGIVKILEQIDETGAKTIEESFVVREASLITPYTEEQQVVYNQIKEAYSYKNVTNIFSLDEVSPIIEVAYKKDLETLEKNKEERLLALENAILGGN